MPRLQPDNDTLKFFKKMSDTIKNPPPPPKKSNRNLNTNASASATTPSSSKPKKKTRWLRRIIFLIAIAYVIYLLQNK